MVALYVLIQKHRLIRII